MGKLEMLPHRETIAHTIRKGVNTQSTNYLVEEETLIFIIRLKSQSRYYNGSDSSKPQARTRVWRRKER